MKAFYSSELKSRIEELAATLLDAECDVQVGPNGMTATLALTQRQREAICWASYTEKPGIKDKDGFAALLIGCAYDRICDWLRYQKSERVKASFISLGIEGAVISDTENTVSWHINAGRADLLMLLLRASRMPSALPIESNIAPAITTVEEVTQ
jgi:hypothetical protein